MDIPQMENAWFGFRVDLLLQAEWNDLHTQATPISPLLSPLMNDINHSKKKQPLKQSKKIPHLL